MQLHASKLVASARAVKTERRLSHPRARSVPLDVGYGVVLIAAKALIGMKAPLQSTRSSMLAAKALGENAKMVAAVPQRIFFI